MENTSTDQRRRRWLLGSTCIALAGVLPAISFAHGAAAHVEMWTDEGCECCNQWARHLQNYQFDVAQRKVDDVAAMRKQLGMPER